MSLLKYFNKLLKDGDVYPKKVSSLTPKQLEIVNQKVQEVKRNENCGTYNKYLPEERARIGKYTAEYGPAKASKHFSKSLLKTRLGD